ncbi:MAG TPA: RDD family protein [Chryseolinea sp.]
MNTTYAGFWLRFAAYLIDYIIIYTVQSFVFVPVLGLMGISFASKMDNVENMSDAETMGMAMSFAAIMGATALLTTIIAILYWSLMESSKYQATLGKMALGLRVSDVDGKNLDFVKSLIRNVCKIISGMIFGVGYIMAGFTEKKQGLHDMIAGTLVVKK